MQGPSLCIMCKQNEENIEHLFNNYSIGNEIWQLNEALFGQTDRDNTSVNGTICNWRRGVYKSEVVNRAWRLSIGFVLWAIWKERNY